MMVYLEDEDRYVPDDEVKKGDRVLNISGTELRERLNEGREFLRGSRIRRLCGIAQEFSPASQARRDHLFHRPLGFR